MGYSIFSQRDAWDDLKYMMRDAVLCRFDEEKTFHINYNLAVSASGGSLQ